MKAVSVAYLLDDTVLFGGVKVVFRQAELLAARGHDVTVVARGPRPDWYELEVPFSQVAVFSRETVPEVDVVVATYWSTIEPALGAARREVAHYCQGFEALYTHNVEDHPAIVAAYRHRLPALVVSPHLGTILADQFRRPSRVVLQPLEEIWRPPVSQRIRRRPTSPYRILVPGPWEGDWKGVPTGLKAVAALRREGMDVRLVRLSQYPISREEADLLEADEYYEHVAPPQAAHIVQSCDLVLAPSWEQEGFGLPVLEAMAAGVPVVASDISSFRAFAGPAAVLVPYDDPDTFADAAVQILTEPKLWRRHRRRGFSVAARYSPRQSARSAERALEWVATGAWKAEL
jgi:glycosyltransferase involved in cell wall biosynthesis